jgi:hypothetical protein
VLDWREFVHLPGHSRVANRLEELGISIHSTARLVPHYDLWDELRSLGRALAAAARDARSANRLLREESPAVLERQLADHRVGSYTEPRLRHADELVVRVAALEDLAKARRQFETEGRRLERRARTIRARVFDARLDPAKVDDLLLDVRLLREAAEEIAATLHQACDQALRALPRG